MILHDKKSWTELSTVFTAKIISISKAINVKDTIRIVPSTVDDFRAVTKELDTRNLAYHTFILKEDRPKLLRVAIRGIPENIPDEAITEELRALGYAVLRTKRLLRGEFRTPLDIVHVDVRQDATSPDIFALARLFHLTMNVEKRNKMEVTQCFRCQRYGHTNISCALPLRCVRCAGEHLLKDCTVWRFDPRCCNCGGDHSAGWKLCPSRPDNKQTPRSAATKTPSVSPERPTQSEQRSVNNPHLANTSTMIETQPVGCEYKRGKLQAQK